MLSKMVVRKSLVRYTVVRKTRKTRALQPGQSDG